MKRRLPFLLTVHLKDRRERRGFSQRELAHQVGITRQAVSAIEAQTYVPNTEVALRLARALRCRVEDLFRCDDAEPGERVELATPVSSTRRVALGCVRGHWIAKPLDGVSIGEGGFLPADGLATDVRSARQVELLTSESAARRSAIVLGCDPALAILAALVRRRNPDVGLTWIAATSAASLDAVRRGEAHVGGTHLRSGPAGEQKLRRARRALEATGGIVVSFARWEVGLAVAPAASQRVRAVADLARRDVKVINRQIGAGARALLDDALSAAGITPDLVRGYDRTVAGHVAAASAVAAGAADAAVTIRATAEAFGLAFIALAEERFDFAIPTDHVEHPAVTTMLEVLQGREMRAEMRALPGYDASTLGEVVGEVDPAP